MSETATVRGEVEGGDSEVDEAWTMAPTDLGVVVMLAGQERHTAVTGGGGVQALPGEGISEALSDGEVQATRGVAGGALAENEAAEALKDGT